MPNVHNQDWRDIDSQHQLHEQYPTMHTPWHTSNSQLLRSKEQLSCHFFSSWATERDFLSSLKYPMRGVRGLLTSLACFMLNFSRTHSTYLSHDNQIFLVFLSRLICIPKICLSGLNPSYQRIWKNAFSACWSSDYPI